MFPLHVFAQNEPILEGTKSIVGKISATIINPLIVLLFAVAITIFVFGIIKFLANQDNTEEKENGKKHMMYGLIGLFIMISAFAIMRVIDGTLSRIDPDPSGGTTLETAGY
ncbi:MAG: pilin [Candidatus Nomurabacteria bacterium]|nr:pilin [Candidatus Nomurabacteria bacterium]